MARSTTDADRDALAPERALEVAFDVPGTEAGALVDPARLGEWFASDARVDGDALHLCIEEEYGYRRHVLGRVASVEPGRAATIEVERAEREWDGNDGDPVGPVMPPARWHEPEFDDTRIDLRVVEGVARVRWSGFASDALDATRRVGTLLRWSVERASAMHGDGALRRQGATVQLDAGPMAAWRALGELVAEPGGTWYERDGDASGRALLTVAGRRLAASWRGSDEAEPSGLLDVRIAHERAGGSIVEVELAVVEAVEHDVADAFVERLASLLADRATERAVDA